MFFLQKSQRPARVMFFALLALLAGPAPEAGAQNTGRRAAILMSGNRWVTGIPGFGDNAFPALIGQYRLETAAPGEEQPPAGEGGFSIWLTAEPLVFPEGLWRPWGGLPGALERKGGEGHFISLPPSAERGAWTAVFLFPGPVPDDASLNRLIGAWTDRFLYYFSLVKIPTDVSMPAAVYF
ncbi:MAG: hypothetical protein LBS06_05145 [Treponema sp.]|jgi:hypothetical protein|nr:hypothetical protein [Treponema sp.]